MKMHRIGIVERATPIQVAVGGRIQKLLNVLRWIPRSQRCQQRINGAPLTDIKGVTLGVQCIIRGWIRRSDYKAMAALSGRFSITARAASGIITTLLGGNLGAAGGACGLYGRILYHPIHDIFHPVPNLPEVRLISDAADI